MRPGEATGRAPPLRVRVRVRVQVRSLHRARGSGQTGAEGSRRLFTRPERNAVNTIFTSEHTLLANRTAARTRRLHTDLKTGRPLLHLSCTSQHCSLRLAPWKKAKESHTKGGEKQDTLLFLRKAVFLGWRSSPECHVLRPERPASLTPELELASPHGPTVQAHHRKALQVSCPVSAQGSPAGRCPGTTCRAQERWDTGPGPVQKEARS